ncbi:MAG TPA: CocE/NonD family hydrolase [Myxococcota bacterium]|nr:CocE/NonD family hydrolase [Myxococcota bacterium]HRY93768.1 CocE/NonD family hydrolase [Myxococcota bacterium]
MRGAVLGLWVIACALLGCDPGGDGPDADGSDGSDGSVGSDGSDGGPDEGPDDQAPDCARHVFEDVSIPLRDGQALAAFVRRAQTPGCRLPTILIQTPYDKENARTLWLADPAGEPLFASPDYNFVVLDWRGFFGSRAAAVQGAQPYGQDGYDAVEWIAARPWSDGQVGTWGVSALCVQQWRTALERPPHLRAFVPIFCQANTTYAQYYPGGVLRQEYVDFLSAYFGMSDLILAHPYRDALWRAVEGLLELARVEAPALVVAGWWDLHNPGSLQDFEALRTLSPEAVRALHRLLIGPWIHFATGGESQGAGRQLDAQELLYVDADRRIQRDSLAFFDLHLRGRQSEASGWAPARWLTGGDGLWESAEAWPPTGAARAVFYPAPGGALAGEAPAESRLDFPCDPDDPSPSVGGCTLLPSLYHGPRDQAEVVARPDALVFVSEPLAEPLRLRATARAELEVSTSGQDADFAVRLTDVAPDGAHLLLGEGIQRLKLAGDLGAPAPVAPGQRATLTVWLANELGYTFAAGHRVGLVVSGSNYPRFARNPNSGADFYQDAASSVTVQSSVHLGGATRLVLPAGR